ncbi:MAG: GDP-mannose 4,6-dehydratase [Pyrinomonadaceae bacterium]
MSDYQGRAVLVTGGAGFIGSHIVEELVRRGADVTVVDNLTTGYMKNLAAVSSHVQFCALDLVHDDLRALFEGKDFSLIVHTAANANVPDSVADPRMDFERNAVATLNLLEAARAHAPQVRIIHTSSAAVYGKGSNAPTPEDAPAVPVSPYGTSKLASEHYMAVYAQLYGLRTATLRLFPVYGPRLRKQVVYDLMYKVHRNSEELPIQGDGKQERDFNYITNVVAAYTTVIERARLEGEVYNVAAEETVTIHQLAEMICERMGVAPRFRYSGNARAGDMQRLCADISRLKSLDYQPRVSFADGLDETVAWFREEMAVVPA